MNQKKFLFILCPPHSGSTLLLYLVGTSKNSSVFEIRGEGQYLTEAKSIMRVDPYNEQMKIPWNTIKKIYEKNWDMTKSVLVDKSPPNLIRAPEIEVEFENSFFITMLRNPYPWCYGIKNRKTHLTFTEVALMWLHLAKYQIKNIHNLSRVLSFTYEDLCDNPEKTVKKIETFIPELNDIDITQKFRIHTLEGKQEKQITNLNNLALSKLTNTNLAEISKVLRREEDVMKFFSYEILS